MRFKKSLKTLTIKIQESSPIVQCVFDAEWKITLNFAKSFFDFFYLFLPHFCESQLLSSSVKIIWVCCWPLFVPAKGRILSPLNFYHFGRSLPSLVPFASFDKVLLLLLVWTIWALLPSWFGEGRKVVESTKLPTKLSTFDNDSCLIAIIVPACSALFVLLPCRVTSVSCWSETVVRRAKRISVSEIVRWWDGDVLLSVISVLSFKCFWFRFLIVFWKCDKNHTFLVDFFFSFFSNESRKWKKKDFFLWSVSKSCK